jgi:hypothetical protein
MRVRCVHRCAHGHPNSLQCVGGEIGRQEAFVSLYVGVVGSPCRRVYALGRWWVVRATVCTYGRCALAQMALTCISSCLCVRRVLR